MKIEVITVGPIDVNCHVLYCEEHKSAVIVDPGDSGKRIAAFLDGKGLIPKLIVNTHCHADHTGAVGYLVDSYRIPFLCHEKDEGLLTDDEQSQMAEYMGLKRPPKNDGTVEDGEEIDLCEDFKLRVIHTPGHTQGGVCLLGGGNLIVGDTLFRTSIGRSDLTGGNHAQLVRSIRERLFTLPDDTVVWPGHGDPTTIGYERAHNPFLRQTEGFA